MIEAESAANKDNSQDNNNNLSYKERQEEYKKKQKRKNKVYSFLGSRGFSGDIIKKVMNEKF